MGKYDILFQNDEEPAKPAPMGKAPGLVATPASPHNGKYSILFQDEETPAPKPDAYAGFDKATDYANKASNFANIAAPIAAIAEGAPALPVLGGLAGSYAAGAGANYLMDKTGAAPWLQNKAQQLQNSLPEPQTRSVPLNMALNIGQQITDPRAAIANMLSSLPAMASAYVAMKGGNAGGNLFARDNPLITSLIGTPKVPQGQEGSAYINRIGEQLGTPKVPQGPMQMGEVKQGLRAGRSQLGAVQGAAQDAAIAAARTPENPSAMVQEAIDKALASLGTPEGKPQFATSPSGAEALLNTSKNLAPKASNLEDVLALQKQLSQQGASARKPNSPVSAEAPYYEKASKNLRDSINSLIPEEQLAPLNLANKNFSAMANLQNMGIKSNSNGNFRPAKMVSQWNNIEPSEKTRVFGPELTQALDSLFSQGSPGVLGRATTAGRLATNARFGDAIKTLVGGKKVPTSFAAPIEQTPFEMAKNLRLNSALVGINQAQ